jgi:hypothetical protein
MRCVDEFEIGSRPDHRVRSPLTLAEQFERAIACARLQVAAGGGYGAPHDRALAIEAMIADGEIRRIDQ